MIPTKDILTRTSLRTPKAAAIAGIVFSILLTLIVLLLRLSVPTDPLEPGAWLKTNSKTVALAMNLVPFDGVAFPSCGITRSGKPSAGRRASGSSEPRLISG